MNQAQFLAYIFFLFRSYDPIRKLSRLQKQPGTSIRRCESCMGSDGRTFCHKGKTECSGVKTP
jgi:hypothetical protein